MTTFGGMKYEDVVKMKKACDKFCKDDSISRGAFFWGYMQGVNAEREACAEVCKKHADVYAKLEGNSTAQSAWAACIDNRDAIRARGQE
jgi:hypothetical protein